MTDQIMTLIVQIVISLVGVGLLYLLDRVRLSLKQKAEAEDASALDKVIYELVEAAEQQLKADDPDGHVRKQYVVDLLERLGYAVNEELNAKIEAAVFELNLLHE